MTWRGAAPSWATLVGVASAVCAPSAAFAWPLCGPAGGQGASEAGYGLGVAVVIMVAWAAIARARRRRRFEPFDDDENDRRTRDRWRQYTK